ncbi:MAG: amidohydrolase [Alphaproteobacteria bacterium]
MTRTLIRDATIVTMDARTGCAPVRGDILIDGAAIAAIGPDLQAGEGTEIVDGRDRLVMPGLVNAHTHSSETFFKGRYERMPLEIWLLYAYGMLAAEPLPPRLLYLRSLLLAMESLRGGVTLLCDDFFDPPAHDIDRLGIVFQAYADAGIRANVSSVVMDVPALDALPYARAIMPPEVQTLLPAGPPVSVEAYIAFCREALARFAGRDGRLNYMIAPSAPQRCTPAMLQVCHALAVEAGVPFHLHVLETVTQAVTGPMLYGKSLVRHMADLGVLSRNTTIAHAVWVDDDDIALMGAAGCSVAHNAISNQKLGAGIAPVRRLMDAGVTVALGTDGLSSNDTARIFDVMRVAGLIHSATGPDYGRWLGAEDVLRAATIGGARSAMLDATTGSLEPGKAADLIVLDLAGYAFTPLNDIAKHLVFAENGSSIERVMVAGRWVLKDGALTVVDERAVLAEIRDAVPALLKKHAQSELANRALEPWFAEIHRRASCHPRLDRYAGDGAA